MVQIRVDTTQKKARPGGILRVLVDEETYEVKELGSRPGPKGDTVFHLRPYGLEFSFLVPVGEKTSGKGKARWAAFFAGQALDEGVVGWENAFDQKKKPLPFKVDILRDGSIDPNIGGALVWHLIGILQKVKGLRKGRRGNSPSSGTTPKPRSSSGSRGRGRGAAASAKTSA